MKKWILGNKQSAPLCSFAYITVNGEDWGLYLAVEAVEDSFLERNYGNDYGDLYKPDSMNFGGGGPGNGKNFNMTDFIKENTVEEDDEEDSDSEQENGNTGSAPDMQQGNFDFSNIPNMGNGNFDPSNIPNMGDGNFDPSNMPNMGEGGFDPSQAGVGNMPKDNASSDGDIADSSNGAKERPSTDRSSSNRNSFNGTSFSGFSGSGQDDDLTEIILLGSSALVLVVGIIFASIFKRRK